MVRKDVLYTSNIGSIPVVSTLTCYVSEVVNTSDFQSGGMGSIPIHNTMGL